MVVSFSLARSPSGRHTGTATGGKHTVIDKTFKEDARFKNTAEDGINNPALTNYPQKPPFLPLFARF
jgi:hypothetical protein